MKRTTSPTIALPLLLLTTAVCQTPAVKADPEPTAPPAATTETTPATEPAAAEPVADEPVTTEPAAPTPATTEPVPEPAAEAPSTEPASEAAPAAPVALEPQSTAPTAVMLMNADGVTYYRYPLQPVADKAAAPQLKPWLVQRAPDAVARLAPDASAVLTRRDRRDAEGEIIQQLILVTPGDPASTETKLTLDTAAIAAVKGWTNFRLRSISGLQWPLRQTAGPERVLLRLTYEQKETDAGVAAATQELLGWYDLKAQTFTPIWNENRLLGVELSAGGSFMHVLALRPQANGVQSGEGGDATALLLDAEGKELPAKVLRALRTVGYLYRGWSDDTHLLLKRAGQNQLVVYDVANDTVAVPKGLDTAWTASAAPNGATALVWQSEESVDAILPQPIDTTTGATLPWDTKTWGDAPLAVASWSADSRYFLLLGKRNPRGNYGKVLVVGTTPFSTQEITLPADAAISAARFVYEPAAKPAP